MPTAPVFLATKWDAFFNRGNNDVLGSSDLEDIITLVAGRVELLAELPQERADLQNWISAASREFLDHPDAGYAVQGALPDTATLPDYLTTVLGRFETLADLSH